MKGVKTTFKDDVVPVSSGAGDLEFEGPAKGAGADFKIEGQDVVVTLGEGLLDSFLNEINP